MPTSDFSKYRLLAPGPVPLSREVVESFTRPMLHHRTPEFESILVDALQNLRWFFQTAQPVMILASTGSGGMEAALVNTLAKGDQILVVNAGKFGERWKEMADVYGILTDELTCAWGETLDLKKFEDAVQKKPYKAVLSQVCETSTATLLPVREMIQIYRKYHQGLFMVDAITALGCTPLPMDEWDIDAVVAGSQKAFALPTGLAFVALSKRAWEAQKTANLPRYSFDLKKERQANEKKQTYFSSSVLLIRALAVILDSFKKQGLDHLIALTERRARATREGAKILGFDLFSKSPSPSVTAVVVQEGVDGSKLRSHIEEKYNVTLMGGQDRLQGKILRFGHMGAIETADVLAGLEALALSVNDLKPGSISEEAIEKALSVAERILS